MQNLFIFVIFNAQSTLFSYVTSIYYLIFMYFCMKF